MQNAEDILFGISPADKLPGTSAFNLSEEFTEADLLKIFDELESSQSFHAQQTNEECRTLLEREQTPLHKERCDSSESDSTETNELPTAENTRVLKSINLRDEPLHLQCEWQDCGHFSHNLDDFARHVSFHIPHLEVRMNEKQEGVYACLWRSCTFESADSNEIVRHVNFHSYHTKIKNIGSNILSRLRLPVCKFSDIGRNVVPNLPYAFDCCWGQCERTFNNPHMYYRHVQGHLHFNSFRNNVKRRFHCGWRGCKSVFRSNYKLAEHTRRHTQEKLVGCPTCGELFANKTKFSDHCKRQIPFEMRGYQCSHCFRYYSSERLLQEHARCHVNRYKCAFCDITCYSASNLVTHIRFRHLNSKPFKCNFCKYTAKRKYDLEKHLKIHYPGPVYRCEEEGCRFSCRSANVLRRHRDYKRDEYGYFRLQTERHEILDEAHDVKEPESCTIQPLCGSSQAVFDDGDSLKQEAAGRGVLITIMELDESGNVLSTQEINTDEVSVLPPGYITIFQG
ncbi:hypothetical protein B7P43_G13153 [Cryptotermes secundus]|uniref:C2H2-type domain-containing protein n=1 Tax=Cryptotermes secundus TaxID=105785 RepID=A0A2J7QUU1_9NEOP|nr:hypothetical protein B7P43_G13153 [Cryptotermes secundus]